MASTNASAVDAADAVEHGGDMFALSFEASARAQKDWFEMTKQCRVLAATLAASQDEAAALRQANEALDLTARKQQQALLLAEQQVFGLKKMLLAQQDVEKDLRVRLAQSSNTGRPADAGDSSMLAMAGLVALSWLALYLLRWLLGALVR